MSPRPKTARKRERTPHKKRAVTPRLPVPSSRPGSPALVRADRVLDECVGTICLVEVTLHSLESQEIASPEQEVLKRALKAIWVVHDWINGLPTDPDHVDADQEDEP